MSTTTKGFGESRPEVPKTSFSRHHDRFRSIFYSAAFRICIHVRRARGWAFQAYARRSVNVRSCTIALGQQRGAAIESNIVSHNLCAIMHV